MLGTEVTTGFSGPLNLLKRRKSARVFLRGEDGEDGVSLLCGCACEELSGVCVWRLSELEELLLGLPQGKGVASCSWEDWLHEAGRRGL